MLLKVNRIIRSIISLNRRIEFNTIVDMLSFNNDDNLLDVGSGDGFWTNKFSYFANQVVGVDPTKNLLNLSIKHYKKKNLKFVYGSAEKLPFDDNSFNKVASVSTVEHFNDPEVGLSEMARVLKRNGLLSISVDSLNEENSSKKIMDWHSKKHFVTKYFTIREIIAILEKNGLRIVQERTKGIFYSRLSSFLRFIFIKNTKLLLPFFPVFYFLCRISDKFLIGGEVSPQILIIKARKI
jgi:ubiquinone/menaquinone biosynthesis C-methylase UbiE